MRVVVIGKGSSKKSATANKPARKRKAKPLSIKKQDKYMRVLTPDQWAELDGVARLLKPIADAQVALEGEQYVTLSSVPFYIKQIRVHLADMCKSTNASIKEAAILMKRDFDARWPEASWPRAVLIAVALDPRTKRMNCFNAEEKKEAWRLIEQEMRALHKQDTVLAAAAATQTASSGQSTTKTIFDQGDDDGDDTFFADSETQTTDTELNDMLLQKTIDTEVSTFHALPRIEAKEDPVARWKKLTTSLPMLTRVARKWLAVPASSASSERMFSSAGLTISKKRTRLGPERAATLVFLKTAWPVLERHGKLYGDDGPSSALTNKLQAVKEETDDEIEVVDGA